MKRSLALALALVLLVGCGAPATTLAPQEPIAAAPPTATLVPSATPTQAATAEEPVVTATAPAAEATLTPTPTATPEPPAWTSHSNLDDVNDLLEASDGRIWAATSGGVVVWDLAAASHTLLRVEDGLPANDARAIAQTPDGAIWIGTSAGLARIEEGRVVGHLGSAVLGSADVQALLVDRDGRLWVGTQGAGAVRYDGESWQPLHFATSQQANNVYSLYEDGEGRIWFGGMGLARLAGDDWQVFTDKAVAGRGVLAIAADGIEADGGDQLWFGTAFDLVGYDGQTFTTHNFPGQALHTVRAIWRDGQERLWLGTEKGGAWIVDGRQWRQLTAADGLPVTAVRRFTTLHDGRLLLATDQGIYEQLRDGWRAYQVGGGPAGNDIRALLLDMDGVLWAAARGRPLSAYNDASWQEVGRPGEPRPMNVSALAQTPDGLVWAAEPGKGLWQVQGDTSRLLTERQGIASAQITGLAVDAAGALWVATLKGLSVWDGAEWRTYTTRQGLPANELALVAAGGNAAGQGIVWVAGIKGEVARYDGASWAIFGPGDGLPALRPASMAASGDGVVLGYGASRSTERQLAIYDGANWELLTPADGLPDGDPIALLDDQGWLWVGTSGHGLTRYADGVWSVWPSSGGPASGQVHALATDGQGVLWMGTSAGITRLDTALLD